MGYGEQHQGLRLRKKSKRRERNSRQTSQITYNNNNNNISDSSTTNYICENQIPTHQHHHHDHRAQFQNSATTTESEVDQLVEKARQNIHDLEHLENQNHFWSSLFRNISKVIVISLIILILLNLPLECTDSKCRAKFTSLADFRPFGITLFEVSYPNGPPPV